MQSITNKRGILNRTEAVLVVVDVQERFSTAILEFTDLVKKIGILAEGCQILKVPTIVTEQYPRGLGRTVKEITGRLTEHTVVEKLCFSSVDAPGFLEQLRSLGRTQIIVAGIEAHVCVSQTVHGLLQENFTVHIPIDAIGSREAVNKEVAIKKMEAAGAVFSSVEMALFELLQSATAPEFKAIQALVM